jgi:hypothetical protein
LDLRIDATQHLIYFAQVTHYTDFAELKLNLRARKNPPTLRESGLF